MLGRLVTCLVLVALAPGCGAFSDDIGDSSPEIADAVGEAGSTGKPFRLADVTHFEWDEFHVFGPYSTAATINEQLGFKWDDAESSAIESLDRISLLVFVRDGEVVKAYEHEVADGHFDCLDQHVLGRRGFSVGDSVLRVERLTYSSETNLVAVPAHPRDRREARTIATCLRTYS